MEKTSFISGLSEGASIGAWVGVIALLMWVSHINGKLYEVNEKLDTVIEHLEIDKEGE